MTDTTDYGMANLQTFEHFFKAAGGQIVATESAPVGTTNFRPLLTKIKGLAPDAIYFGGVVTEAGLVRRQMVEFGLKQPMIGVDGFYDPQFIQIAGPAADGTIVGLVKEEGNAKLDQMMKDYAAAKFDEPAGPYTKNAFDAANIIIAAMGAGIGHDADFGVAVERARVAVAERLFAAGA